MVVAVAVLASGWRLLRQANAVLLEGTPHDVAPDDVAATMAAVPGVESVHDLHVWSLDGTRHALSAHVVVAGHPTLEEAQAIGTEVKRAVSAPYGIAHATVELECEGCVDDGNWCAL
jgi:cobalt-zinc-cadmium efflux system protein